MNSIHQQIAVRVTDALSGATVGVDDVFRDRTAPVTRDEMPCITVRRVREQKEPISKAADSAMFTLNVCVHVRGEPWTDAADPIAVQVHRTLCGDQQLAGLVASVRNSGAEWEDHDGDQSAGCLTLEYQFRYAVRASDITNSNIF
jgi:hypothetical protein